MHSKKIIYCLRWFFNRPFWVFVVCMFGVSSHLSCSGALARIWNMGVKQKQLTGRLTDLKQKNHLVEEQLSRLSDRHFLEQEAKSRFNLVGERDIVFIFSEEK